MKFINKLSSLVDIFLDWSNSPKKFLKIFQILIYYTPAVLTPVAGLYSLVQIFDIPMFGLTHIGLILTVILASFFVFRVYWSRAKDFLSSSQGNDFFIIPAISHLIKTLGEVAFTICATSPIAFVFMQFDVLFRGGGYGSIGPDFGSVVIIGVIAVPLYGYGLMIASKFVAESLSALAAIANNTARIK